MPEHDLAQRYRRYIDLCNARRFDQLGDFVADDVVASETATGLDNYVRGLADVVAGFSDYHWRIDQVIVDDVWIAARLTGTGTHTGRFRGIAATRRHLRVQELAMYRTSAGKIEHCWGDLGSTLRDELVSGTPE
jgi:predicted ester cyclase